MPHSWSYKICPHLATQLRGQIKNNSICILCVQHELPTRATFSNHRNFNTSQWSVYLGATKFIHDHKHMTPHLWFIKVILFSIILILVSAKSNTTQAYSQTCLDLIHVSLVNLSSRSLLSRVLPVISGTDVPPCQDAKLSSMISPGLILHPFPFLLFQFFNILLFFPSYEVAKECCPFLK